MTKFVTRAGWTLRGEIAGYYISAKGEHMARIRLYGTRACADVPVAGLIVEVR